MTHHVCCTQCHSREFQSSTNNSVTDHDSFKEVSAIQNGVQIYTKMAVGLGLDEMG